MAPGLGDLLGKLFGGGGKGDDRPQADPPVSYKGYAIVAAPRQQGGAWVVAGQIMKDGDSPDAATTYDFVRADSYTSRDQAAEFTVIKAKQIIDLEGDRIFERLG
jgi:hypothetical protein